MCVSRIGTQFLQGRVIIAGTVEFIDLPADTPYLCIEMLANAGSL